MKSLLPEQTLSRPMDYAHTSEPSVADWMRSQASASSSTVEAGEERPQSRVGSFVLPSALIAGFLFLQMFDYHALGMSTVTPDRILFLFIFGGFVAALRSGRAQKVSMSGLEWTMLLFAGLCVVSYIISNPDGGQLRFKWLITLFNLIFCPFGIFLVARSSR